MSDDLEKYDCMPKFTSLVRAIRVPTGQGKVREICFSFKVREKSGNFVKWSGKLDNLKKSGKSQGIIKIFWIHHRKKGINRYEIMVMAVRRYASGRESHADMTWYWLSM